LNVRPTSAVRAPIEESGTPIRRWTTAQGNLNMGQRRFKNVIESLGVYLPARAVSTDDILNGCRTPLRFPFERLTGIGTRRVAGEGELSIDLAKRAIEICLSRSKRGPEDIDILLSCNICRYDRTDFGYSFEPNTAVQLRHHFGCTGALAIDVANACAGLFTGISIVDTLLDLGVIRCGLVVSGDYISHLAATAQAEISGFADPRLACLTLGDAAAAVVLERSDTAGVGFAAIDLYTLGRHSDLCVARPSERTPGGAIMLTDSAAMSAIGIEHSLTHLDRTLTAAGWAISDVDHIVPHQTSRSTLRRARAALEERYGEGTRLNVVDNLTDRGNTATSTQLVAIWDGILAGRIGAGDRVAFGIAGSGLTIGTALYTFDDLPDRVRRPVSTDSLGSRRTLPRRRTGTIERRRSPGVRIRAVGLACPTEPCHADSLDLATRAAATCLAQTPYHPNDLDVLMYAGVYRDDFLLEPAIATILAGRLGCDAATDPNAGRQTLAFDLFNGGMGFLNGCYLAAEFIRAQRGTVCMVAAAEIENNRGFDKELRGIREIGSAVILEPAGDDSDGFGAFSFRYFTEHLEALTVRTAVAESGVCLAIESDPRFEDHLLACIPPAVDDLLTSECIDRDEIRALLPPLTSVNFGARLAACLDIDPDRVVHACAQAAGDLFTSSLPYGIQAVRDHGCVERGDLGLIINVAAGIQVGCALYTF
jgi:3-oxoacyl-[acyl-carrier-protein] synthase III